MLINVIIPTRPQIAIRLLLTPFEHNLPTLPVRSASRRLLSQPSQRGGPYGLLRSLATTRSRHPPSSKGDASTAPRSSVLSLRPPSGRASAFVPCKALGSLRLHSAVAFSAPALVLPPPHWLSALGCRNSARWTQVAKRAIMAASSRETPYLVFQCSERDELERSEGVGSTMQNGFPIPPPHLQTAPSL